LVGDDRRIDFIRNCLSLDEGLRTKAEWCLSGFLLSIEDDSRLELMRMASQSLPTHGRARLFHCSPFRASTWRLLDEFGEQVRDEYWKGVFPSWGPQHTPAELNELIDRLLEARRPCAAFQAVHMQFKEIETSRLKQLLRDIATVDAEPEGHYRIDSYYISEALSSLDGRAGVTRDEMASFEFLFLGALERSKHGIPNLERQIAHSPALFVQAVSLAYKRSDDGADPSEWRIENSEKRAAVALAAHRLLDQMTRIPGAGDGGRFDGTALGNWLAEARRLCSEYARAAIGDQCLGQLLAKAPEGEDGTWPCEAVCEAMEEICSPEIAEGFQIGVRNSRGLQLRGEGGEQERMLAAKYRAMAERLHFEYPYVGGILESIADSYEREAGWWDSEENVAKRLRS
jgi:hypothetical protein